MCRKEKFQGVSKSILKECTAVNLFQNIFWKLFSHFKDFGIGPHIGLLRFCCLGQPKENLCLRKSGWPKKSPPGRQGIHFFSWFSDYTYKLSFQRNRRNKLTVKVNKANWSIVMSTIIYLILQWRFARIRYYFNSYPPIPIAVIAIPIIARRVQCLITRMSGSKVIYCKN